MKTKLIYNFCLFILLLTSAHAAGSTIDGVISDSNTGSPLMGANIMLDGTMLGAASDEKGSYLISDVPIGSYTIKAMFIGYETFEREIRVEADEQYIIDMALKPSAIELEETRVTAEKRKEKITGAPASIEIITSRDIKGKTTTNIGAYLKGLKGIDFTSSGINNYSISVRGFNSSFNTRLLTLSDGRVANIPALRVINYSSIPQSMDDVDKIEVLLGPTTALYGANAHSGVINIVSKPPSQSEGLTMSISGSNDERQLRKINGRFAKKLSDNFSIKISGLYLHAYDWPFISEEEYKTHRYPWTLTPYRVNDGKDNNPWHSSGVALDSSNTLTLYSEITEKWYTIGNGEQMDTGDPDGDGVMGEDWYNGYDDDGDGLIDEDYFIANGLDDGGIPCTGDSNEDDCYCCSGDWGVDEGIDDAQDLAYDGVDNDQNGIIDDESGPGVIESNVKAWGANIENNILILFGREDSLIEGEINPYYVPNLAKTDLLGNHRFNEDEVKLEFDIFTYDYGFDGLPGDPFLDKAGDSELQIGECLNHNGGFPEACDKGLDGIANTDDFGEGDGIWQPGDGWVDDGDGVVNFGESGEPPKDTYSTPDENDIGIWPPKNGVWDENEEIFDWGHDGIDNTGDPGEHDGELAMDGFSGDPFVDLNNNGLYDQPEGEEYIDINNNGLYDGPTGEFDGIFDTGDGLYGFEGEPFSDYGLDGIQNTSDSGENDKIRQSYETFTDTNNDGQYNAPDLIDDYQVVLDNNGDGLSDYPDFEIDNRKLEFRLDFDPNPDFNMTFQSGYSWTKTQQVTGTGRYIADGFEYKFYQIRSRYKNWFSQFYMNQGASGNTRGYLLGNRIIDKSKNFAYQLQNNFDTPSINTKFVWGMDYFRTEPYTNGTILNDGPNGYDNDGDFVIIAYNLEDDDNDGIVDDEYCSDGQKSGFRNGKLYECYEGIDEPDEFIDPFSNEYGVYYQSTTELFGTSRYELITAARLDYHDLLDEGVLFAPKFGFIYKPDSRSSMRFTYGKAHNTPNSISLFTDLFIGRLNIFEIYLRGNYDGTAYCRVGSPCLGENYPTSVASPGFYAEDDSTFYTFGPTTNITYFDDYPERVNGAPYFFKISGDNFIRGDNIPLDTLVNLIFIPELNGDGILYTPLESINLPDVDPIRTEKIQTIEFGYKGFLGKRTHFSLDYYLSYYEDFFSPPTIITPFIVERILDNEGHDITNIDSLNIQGIMTINDVATYPPYATAFNGLDDDGDWGTWAGEFGWDEDDKDGDCPNGAGRDNPCWADPGEWGFIVYDYNGQDTAIFNPWEVLQNKNGYPVYQATGVGADFNLAVGYNVAGIDEWSEFAGLREHEKVEGATAKDGSPIDGVGMAAAPYHIVLSPMNYGEVWMQGFDFGMTHFITEKLILDGNVSWYGTTDFYNELTKQNDPINAPKWKWNASLMWNSNLGDLIINFRHVDRFKWSDGIWLGDIGPYNIVDIYHTYHITKNLDFTISALNLNNDLHKELVGGAIMGRQIVTRLTSTF